MTSDAQAVFGQKATKAVNGRQVSRDADLRGNHPKALLVTDPGKIRLGGAWRLPASRKAG